MPCGQMTVCTTFPATVTSLNTRSKDDKPKNADWPLWFGRKASLTQSSPRSLRVVWPHSSNATVSRARRSEETVTTRRAVAIALVVCASGAGKESRAATDASDIARQAQERADRVKEQQNEAIRKTQVQQAKDVAKAEKDQAALKKFLNIKHVVVSHLMRRAADRCYLTRRWGQVAPEQLSDAVGASARNPRSVDKDDDPFVTMGGRGATQC
eukprot:3581981-Pyramimonas_sp.AAC.1